MAAAATLTSWRSRGKGPDFVKFGRKIGYPKTYYTEWAEGQRNAGKGRGRKVAYRFQVNGRKYHGPTGLVGISRNRTAAMRIEAAARKAVLEGREDSLKLSVQLFNEAASMFLRWAEGEHRQHPETARRLAVSFASLQPFFGKRPVTQHHSGAP